MCFPTREELIRKASNIPSRPVAVEAFWDGDTAGWFVVLTMIYSKRASFFGSSTFCEYNLTAMRGPDGDLRLFNGTVPPWPEANFASEVGNELAKHYRVPFYFASPNQPEDACPRWWERDKGYPCGVCGILLLQREPCPWRGTCYRCHLASSKREK